jgi:hypothetical protein
MDEHTTFFLYASFTTCIGRAEVKQPFNLSRIMPMYNNHVAYSNITTKRGDECRTYRKNANIVH